MWVSANAMFSVPSVTMNGGSRSQVTRVPLKAPKATQVRIPSAMAMKGLMPLVTASLVITTDPNAMTAPLDRSIPAVRITSVCPIARVPTTMTCWTTSDRLVPVRNRSVRAVKNATASSSAISGPTVERASARDSSEGAASRLVSSCSGVVAGVLITGPRLDSRPRSGPGPPSRVGAGPILGQPPRSLLAPAVGESKLDVLGVHAGLRLGRDERHAGVGVAGHLLAAVGEVDHRVDALAGHLQGVLLRGRGDLAVPDRPHAGAAAVDRDDQHVVLLAGRLERGVRTERGRLVDGVEEVDAGVLLQAVLHRRLALGLVALGVLAADDLRSGRLAAGGVVHAG